MVPLAIFGLYVSEVRRGPETGGYSLVPDLRLRIFISALVTTWSERKYDGTGDGERSDSGLPNSFVTEAQSSGTKQEHSVHSGTDNATSKIQCPTRDTTNIRDRPSMKEASSINIKRSDNRMGVYAL